MAKSEHKDAFAAHYDEQLKRSENLSREGLIEINYNNRFRNYVAYWSEKELQALDPTFTAASPKQIPTMYSNTNFDAIRVFEGASPKSNRSDQALRFIQSLKQNQIKAHVGAGNPFSGQLKLSRDGLSIQEDVKGFFDISYVPQNYYAMTASDRETAITDYKNLLSRNSEIPKFKIEFESALAKNTELTADQKEKTKKEFEKDLDDSLTKIATNHFDILDKLQTKGITIKSQKDINNPSTYKLTITDTNDKKIKDYPLDYLALSHWNDFEADPFTPEQFMQLNTFYNNHKNLPDNHFGVNCSAGLGRSGVVALSFRMLQEGHDKYFNNDVPKFDKIDELLMELRVKRPGLVQNADQYALAVSLAHALHLAKEPEFKITDDKWFEKIAAQTENHLHAYLMESKKELERKEVQKQFAGKMARELYDDTLNVKGWAGMFNNGFKGIYIIKNTIIKNTPTKKNFFSLFNDNTKTEKENAVFNLGAATKKATEDGNIKQLIHPILAVINISIERSSNISIERGKGSEVAQNLRKFLSDKVKDNIFTKEEMDAEIKKFPHPEKLDKYLSKDKYLSAVMLPASNIKPAGQK